MERFRPTKNLNRPKDPKEKLIHFTRLCDAYKIALEGGWSPINEKANDKLKRQLSSLTLKAAKTLFEEYHIAWRNTCGTTNTGDSFQRVRAYCAQHVYFGEAEIHNQRVSTRQCIIYDD